MTLTREEIRLLLHFQWGEGVNYDDAAKKLRERYGVTTSKATAWRWYETFKSEGRQLKDKEHSGRPRKIDRGAVIRTIEASPTMSSRMLADDIGCSHPTILEILHEAGKSLRFEC